jgi:flagellar biosynthesis/type III secretory pathway chaperone
MMQQFMNALIPATAPTTYNGEGTLKTASKPVQVLYEAIG